MPLDYDLECVAISDDLSTSVPLIRLIFIVYGFLPLDLRFKF